MRVCLTGAPLVSEVLVGKDLSDSESFSNVLSSISLSSGGLCSTVLIDDGLCDCLPSSGGRVQFVLGNGRDPSLCRSSSDLVREVYYGVRLVRWSFTRMTQDLESVPIGIPLS